MKYKAKHVYTVGLAKHRFVHTDVTENVRRPHNHDSL